MSKKALIIIDMLNDFIEEKGALYCGQNARAIIPFIQQRLRLYRKNNDPIFYLQDSHDKDDKEFESIVDEILGISKRTPECMVDSNGLPKRVVVTRNGAGLFEKPAAGAKKVTDLSLFRRMYLYVANKDGFHRVGQDPFGEGQSGWIPTDFCIIWDNNCFDFIFFKFMKILII